MTSEIFEYKADKKIIKALSKLPKPLSDSYSYEYLDLLLHVNIVLGFLKTCELPKNFFDHHVYDIFKRKDHLTEAARKLDEMGYREESYLLSKHIDQLYESFKKKFRSQFEKCICKSETK